MGLIKILATHGFRIQNHLANPRTISQVNEDQAPMVAAAKHPAFQDRHFSDVISPQLAAVIRTSFRSEFTHVVFAPSAFLVLFGSAI